ncbi:hypothetical protein HMPREF9241_00450 [Schaalia turicensis ACS-279-V-Col4]|uniref:ABC transporter domain-containing protein n=1 Tax=Schaalia turicensis ACS-279-V-Col4 TaxID=883077 RepID=K0YV96_9ACTO|nr:ABC transporter ATP-binding protein [Schaalia turicensis]EJZ87822.1 hypothetical protein HMPREF9241_00450 [Schaalia turicensis ACS-279-V-Col4]QYB15484.1 ABC transporter ATP-binding protein [Schaalia turicensis]
MSISLPHSQSVSSISSSAPVVALDHVSKIYGQDDTRVAALDDVSVDFYEHTFTAIMGPSGSGKSTMLHMLAGLDLATSGEVRIEGKTLSQLDDDALTRLRRDRIGFVFQSFNLVPTLDARANIELPLHLAGQKPDRRWLSMIIDVLGIGNRLTHRPQEMSGGQQQRVAVARALASKPAVIVADEPTGNLDSASSREVLQLLRATVDQLGQSVIMVTHDQNAALIADRVLVMRDGKIRADLTKPTEAQLSEAAR